MSEDSRQQSREEFLARLRCFQDDLSWSADMPSSPVELETSVRKVIHDIPALRNRADELTSWLLDRPEVEALMSGGRYSGGPLHGEQVAYLLQYLDESEADLVRRNITFGSVLRRELDGICIPVPDSGYVVVLNVAVGMRGSLVARVIANCLVAPRLLETPPRTHQSVARKLLAELVATYPDDVSLFDVTDSQDTCPLEYETPRGRLRMQIGRHWELFLLAHEIAHVVLRHNDEAPRRDVATSGRRVETICHDWSEEYASDLFAWQLLARHDRASQDRDVSLGMQLGVHSLFLFQEAAERKLGSAGQRHPPAADRRRALMARVRYSKRFLDLIRQVEFLLECPPACHEALP